MPRIVCNAKQTKWTHFSKSASVTYMRAQVNLSAIDEICDQFQYPSSSASDSMSILNRFGCIIWRPEWFFIKIFALHNRLRDKFGPYIFHWFWIWHISNIHRDKFKMYTWSICNVVTIPTDTCFFLIIQRDEILLSLFCWVYNVNIIHCNSLAPRQTITIIRINNFRVFSYLNKIEIQMSREV